MGRVGTPGAQSPGEQVGSRREELGLSQADLAGLAGLHVVEVGLVERGDRAPGTEVGRRLAAALGTDPGALGIGPPGSPAPQAS